jgi:hypothetical protein
MDPHDAIIAVRDCKLHEWTHEQLIAAHADCHIELSRSFEASSWGGVNPDTRRMELGNALIAIRSEIASREGEKNAGKRHVESMTLESRTYGMSRGAFILAGASLLVALGAWFWPRSLSDSNTRPNFPSSTNAVPSAPSNSPSIAYTQSLLSPSTGVQVRGIGPTNATSKIPVR